MKRTRWTVFTGGPLFVRWLQAAGGDEVHALVDALLGDRATGAHGQAVQAGALDADGGGQHARGFRDLLDGVVLASLAGDAGDLVALGGAGVLLDGAVAPHGADDADQFTLHGPPPRGRRSVRR